MIALTSILLFIVLIVFNLGMSQLIVRIKDSTLFYIVLSSVLGIGVLIVQSIVENVGLWSFVSNFAVIYAIIVALSTGMRWQKRHSNE